MTSYQDLGIFGVKIPLNVSTVSLPSPSHTFHGAASELDFTLHSRSSKNEIFSTQKVSHHTVRFFFLLKQQKHYGNSYQLMGFCFVKVGHKVGLITVLKQRNNIFLHFHFCIFSNSCGASRLVQGGTYICFHSISGFGVCVCVCLSVIPSNMTIISARRLHRPL